MLGNHSVLDIRTTPLLSVQTSVGSLNSFQIYTTDLITWPRCMSVCMWDDSSSWLMRVMGEKFIQGSSAWRLRLCDLRSSASQPAKDASFWHLQPHSNGRYSSDGCWEPGDICLHVAEQLLQLFENWQKEWWFRMVKEWWRFLNTSPFIWTF